MSNKDILKKFNKIKEIKPGIHEDAIFEIIKNIHNNGRDYSKIRDLLPYDVRYSLFVGDVDRTYINKIYGYFIKYAFSPEEALFLYSQFDSKDKKRELFLLLDPKEQALKVNDIEFDSYSAKQYLATVTDDSVRLTLATIFLNKGLISVYSIDSFMKLVSNKDKITFLKTLILYFANDKGIDSYNFDSILNEIDEDNRFSALKLLVDQIKDDSFSSSYVSKCVVTLPVKDRKEALIYILDKFKNKYDDAFYGIDKVLKVFPTEHFFDILQLFVDRGYTNKYTCTSELIENASLDEKIVRIDYLASQKDKKGKPLFDEYTLASIIDKVPKEEGRILFKRYAVEDERFVNLSVCKNIKKAEDLYYYLDYLLELVQPSDFEKAFDTLSAFINEIRQVAKGDVEYSYIIDMYVRKYELDRVHLVEFIKRFNYQALRFMNSESIQLFINLPDEEFVKFLNLFNKKYTELDNNIINSICNSFLQRQFRLENSSTYAIFATFEDLLRVKGDDSRVKLIELLGEVGDVIDINSYLKKNELDFDTFVDRLEKDDKSAVDLLHDMTQEYIMKKREVYVVDHLTTVFDEIGVEKKVERGFFKKKIIELSNSMYDISFKFSSDDERLTQEEKDFLANDKLFQEIYEFKKHKKPINAENKKYLKVFESLLNKYYEYKYEHNKFEGMECPYSYFPIPVTEEHLLGVIVECNIPQIVDKLLGDKDLYNELVSLLNKYKMLGWEKTFSVFGERAEVDFNEGTLASIISYYYVIGPLVKEKNANLTQFLDYANCYDSVSKTYSYLLGKDNFRAIAANEGKNKADMSKMRRLAKIPELIRSMYGKKEITVPPIDKDYETSSGKRINIVLGNTTNMINMSYGERTNSCLRIGGAFNDLFEFCLGDKNGFHMRFTDPDTGKFITRVSGIRNGNTVFLNELRDSEDSKYTNEESVEVLDMVTKDLIELTKDSEYPIENVVISYDYAMGIREQESIPTGLIPYPDALYKLRFNISFDGKFVLLGSTNPNGGLVPYKFGADLADTYKPQRDKVVVLNGIDAVNKVTQLMYINDILCGLDVEDVNIVDVDAIVCIAGEDWCVYIDSAGNIKEHLVEHSNDKARALEEMKNGMTKLQEMLNTQDMKLGSV